MLQITMLLFVKARRLYRCIYFSLNLLYYMSKNVKGGFDMFVMAREPAPNMSAADIKAYFADKHAEKDLADAYAIAHNKFWFVEDNEYDYEEGTPEYKAACAITDEWGALMNEYKNRIFEILTIEGIVIPKTGKIKVMEPFMKRNGYTDHSGWWVKPK